MTNAETEPVGSCHPSILDDPHRIGAVLPQREPGAAAARLRAVAAIHALAEWFVEHPDVPAPEDVHATFRVDTIGELAVHAHHLDEQPYAGGRQFGIVVSGRPIEGDVYVQVFGAVRRPDRPL